MNKVLPELLLTVMLVLLLSFTAWTTLKKAFKMYRKESQMIRESELTKMVHEQDETDAEEAGDELLENMGQSPANEGGGVEESKEEVEVVPESPAHKEALLAEQRRKEELEAILERERHTPMGNIKILVTLFVVVLTINLLKGGGAFPSPLGIRCGSNGFWISNFVMLAWIIIIAILCRRFLIRRYEQKERCGFKYVEGDIKWDPRATWVYPCICCFAGFFAGMFGGTWLSFFFGVLTLNTGQWTLTDFCSCCSWRRHCQGALDVGKCLFVLFDVGVTALSSSNETLIISNRCRL